MNPLENRSLPDGLWQHAPGWLTQADEALQDRLEGLAIPGSGALHWLTESRSGIAAAVGLGLGLYLGIRLWRLWKSGGPLHRFGLRKIAILALFLGLSDLISSGFKARIGRLKPHVNFYNPSFTPALSLPSNHAFNTAFLCALLWFSVDASARKRWRFAFAMLLTVSVITGVSRVIFGQHYPLDVIAGWTIGGTLGWVFAPLYRRFAL